MSIDDIVPVDENLIENDLNDIDKWQRNKIPRIQNIFVQREMHITGIPFIYLENLRVN